MDFIYLGILFFIAEIFFLNFYFFSFGFSAIIVGFLYLFVGEFDYKFYSFFIVFVFLSLISLYVFRRFVFDKFFNKNINYEDLIGEKFIVIINNNIPSVYMYGNYYKLFDENNEQLYHGDIVELINYAGNDLKVRKIK